jgi:isochorismate synthase
MGIRRKSWQGSGGDRDRDPEEIVSVKHSADLEAAAQAALDAAARTGETQWAVLQVEISPCDVLAAFEASESQDRFYWERPAEGRSIAAFGCAEAIEAEGEGRFAEASERAERLFARLHVSGQGAPATAGPFLVGGFAFANAASTEPHWRNFPTGRLVLPEVAIAVAGGRGWCTVVRPVQPFRDAQSVREAQSVQTTEPVQDAQSVQTTEPVQDAQSVQTAESVQDARVVPAIQSGTRARAICDDLRAGLEKAGRSLANRSLIDASTASIAEAGDPLDYRACADRTHTEYRAQVEAALREIADGGFEKVVLARSISVSEKGDYDPCALLDTLRRAHPTCAIFAVARPGAVFLGATPECLVRLVDGRVETASVAGSAPRGRSPEEDLELGRQLRESKKEQTEHAFVVRALCDALTPHCDALDVREAPRLMRLQDIQHLETPITGHLRAHRSVLELLGSVHPTPAVAGAPREAALEWLNANEKLDRGWYSGPIGFADSQGGGEFYAALRSAVLRGSEARLFAGAGVVDGSDPEAELRETRLKLRAMLAPLMEI